MILFHAHAEHITAFRRGLHPGRNPEDGAGVVFGRIGAASFGGGVAVPACCAANNFARASFSAFKRAAFSSASFLCRSSNSFLARSSASVRALASSLANRFRSFRSFSNRPASSFAFISSNTRCSASKCSSLALRSASSFAFSFFSASSRVFLFLAEPAAMASSAALRRAAPASTGLVAPASDLAVTTVLPLDKSITLPCLSVMVHTFLTRGNGVGTTPTIPTPTPPIPPPPLPPGGCD
mmetsp:Transcript_8186/g.14277  ORF Transcript_8186/g.14277 Transcript_8186/m.14277 type:complete len:239 (-) Transcript_8186:565-1281(-)